jgi:L-alanine-DL-glutamate epimerase-like enolase superfamily enzyme
MSTQLRVERQSFPIRGSFAISRGRKTTSEVVLVELQRDGARGRGECVPYARYGESIDSVIDAIESVRDELQADIDCAQLQQLMPAGAARNAVDCALWDLRAKQASKRVWTLAGLTEPVAEVTAYTLSLESPDKMHQAALDHADRPLLKMKLAGDGDVDRVAAVVRGAPKATIIVDANEGWTIEQYHQMVPQLAELGVAMIEQPLPAGEDAALAGVDRPVPLCADESCHDCGTLMDLSGRYNMINIKLDKTGGLTEAMQLRQQAEAAGFDIMVGCMVATSLAMAPATLVASGARVVDLDGPLLLAEDRQPALDYANYRVAAPSAELWG